MPMTSIEKRLSHIYLYFFPLLQPSKAFDPSAMDMKMGKLQETERDGEAWRAIVHGVTKSQT